MGHKKTILLFTLCILIQAALLAADEKNDGQNLDVLADNLKFQNGVEFMKLKIYDKALETFNEYLEIYYNGNHRHEAFKNIAEIYSSRLDYLKAIANYRSLYEEFSTTESGVEAYFNIGICYYKMGYEKKAAGIFNDILENHSSSAYARQAKLQLDILNIFDQ
jgi:TolA-binding protein